MFSEKIDSILKNKSGYFFDNGGSVVIIQTDPSALFYSRTVGGGFRLFAVEVDKKTGAERDYRIYKTDDPFSLDENCIKRFRSFGKGENGTLLTDDLQKPRK